MLLSVGEVAARLGVSSSTVRMWGERYGLTASARSTGGHRRFTVEDVARLQRVHDAVVSGTSPAEAAALVTGIQPTRPRRGGPGGAVLAVPGAGREARGLARAASRLDEMSVEDTVLELLGQHGTLAAWNLTLRPVLVAAGEHWQRTGEGIEVEHMLTQALTTAFVRHVSALAEPPRENPVLLAGGPREEHVLALHAVRSALAERGVPARLLGPRTPMGALATAARRTRAAGALVWLSSPDDVAAQALSEVARAHRRLVLLVGGPGWSDLEDGPATTSVSLDDAVDRLELAWHTSASVSAAR
ncbi:MAG: MerR family transcriptional regulator [Actinomycetota bacterium]